MSPDTPESNRDRDPPSHGDEPLLSLPASLRSALKEPFGPVETDAGAVLEVAGEPLVAVGDVVTYHLQRAGRRPDVAVVDGLTKRSAVDATIERAVTEAVSRTIHNPPGVVTATLVRAIRDAIEADQSTTLLVDGEEDLAALPAIVLAPPGASVVYGQPDEGMVHVHVDEAIRERVRRLLERFEGDDDVLAILEGDLE